MSLLEAFILGLVEGITEFLPISSTGHLIFVQKFLGILDSDFLKTFDVAIQLGAITAVMLLFRNQLTTIATWKKLLLGFIPTGIVGFFLFSHIRFLLENPVIVAVALLVGGVIMLGVEFWYGGEVEKEKVLATHSLSMKQVFKLGCCQTLAMIPGVSRSGAIIVGGLCMRLPREVLTEFTFLLAVPTMIVASGYSLYKHSDIFLNTHEIIPLLVGFITSFVVACGVITLFLGYIKKHSFIPFAVYRIILGCVLLVVFI